MVVKIAESISGTDEGSGCSGGTVRLSIREGGGNDDKLGHRVMRVHDGRESTVLGFIVAPIGL
jgi:hypothetical protein